MINGFVHLISKNGFQNLIQNTAAQVSIETGLKAVGRPAFTLADKNVDKETRKYSAVKELLYQVLCLGIYLAIIPPIFKRGGFKAVKALCNHLEKNCGAEVIKSITKTKDFAGASKCSLNIFKNEKALIAMHELSHLSPQKRQDMSNSMTKKLFDSLEKNIDWKEVTKTTTKEKFFDMVKKSEQKSEFFRQYYIGKGGVEMASIAGSVIGLTILAPELSHLILHPIMKALHMETPAQKTGEQTKTQNLNKQA